MSKNLHESTVDGTINARPLVGMHYHLEGYVCGASCFRSSPFEGWVTFTMIFNQRPNECRYAVAKMVPVFEKEPRGPYLCWDLFDDTLLVGKSHPSGLVPAPPPKWQGDSADALVMKAMALYDRD